MVLSLLQGKTTQFSFNRPKEITVREITVSLLEACTMKGFTCLFWDSEARRGTAANSRK